MSHGSKFKIYKAVFIPSCVSFQRYFWQIVYIFSFPFFAQMLTHCVYCSAVALEIVLLLNYATHETNSTSIYGPTCHKSCISLTFGNGRMIETLSLTSEHAV